MRAITLEINMQQNILLQKNTLPPFKQIKLSDIEPALDFILKENRVELKKLLDQPAPFSWKNLLAPIESLEDRLSQMWSPISHLNSVMNSEELRKIYERCLPKLIAYQTELGQNRALYDAILSIQKSNAFNQLDQTQQKIIHDHIRDFKLAGVALKPEQKKRFTILTQQQAELSNQFANNLLDATHAWTYHTTDKNELSGLPKHTLQTAQKAAKEKNLAGYLLTLDFPIYYAIMTLADNQKLREMIYTAYSTRASDQGPFAGKYDNTKIMDQLLAIRHELAQLVGFENYADYSLATKMANNIKEVIAFSNDLAKRAKPFAKKELETLKKYAEQKFNANTLDAWDIAYYSEKLKEEEFNFTQETLRPYFPVDNVLSGMFNLVENLFHLKIKEKQNIETWHDDVRYFEIYDASQTLRGAFYTDLFARTHKRSGAWMDECRVRRRLPDNTIQTPIAFLTCNFNTPVDNTPSLLTHDEVMTLFHEFGHCLHHLLTTVDYSDASGINGVEWDAVELPSQFMENFCWDKNILTSLSKHYQTGETLPNDLYEKLITAKNFQAGMQIIRQLIFTLFDFRIHLEYTPDNQLNIQAVLDEIRDKLSVMPTPMFNRFQHSFAHIFAGGYAAGYYSYKWAEVLSCDAFAKFEEEGLFNNTTGQTFLKEILEKGGSRKAMDSFIAFRGRPPLLDAFLRHAGLSKSR